MNLALQEIPLAIALMPVESSQIAAIGHDAATSTLAIQFKNKAGAGSVYHYQNFTAELFAAFAGAESIGSHFGKHIKPFAEKFPFTKIEPSFITAAALAGVAAAAGKAAASLTDLADAQEEAALFPTDGELVAEIRRMCAETFNMNVIEIDTRLCQFDYAAALEEIAP